MANIMQQFRAKNKVSRNGYDLSKRLCFTAKSGELLPTYCRLMMTGDKAEVGNFWETTTAPVNTAAYTRFKEYYEWYFVPIHLLWNKFNNWSVNMKDQNNVATSINGTQLLTDDHPYFTTDQIWNYLFSVDGKKNQFGFDRAKCSEKLLSYLGYGDFSSNTQDRIENLRLSPWRLLAYQKVCQDWHRFSQWENSAPERYNINYISGSAESLQIPTDQIDVNRQSMFDLQYCNWNKDLFTGLLPNSQFGDVASIDINSASISLGDTYEYNVTMSGNGTSARILSGDNSSQETEVLGHHPSSSSGQRAEFTGLPFNDGTITNSPSSPRFVISQSGVQHLRTCLGLSSSGSSSSLNSGFTILALRQAEALQKYKEITASNSNDFPSQKDAHFGYRPNEAYSERSRLIHSISANIEIRPVINQNITENDDASLNAADVAGYGHGTGNGKPKTFTADVDGVLICLYHVLPLLDYALPRVDPDNLKTAFTDYAMPEFDKTGMVQVPFAWLTNNTPYQLTDIVLNSKLLGYAPNYIEYKTDIDEVKGAFYNGGLQSWVSPITKEYLATYLFQGGDVGSTYTFNGLDYRFFKVNPSVTDPIFSGENVNSFVDTDKFWVNCYHDVKMVRPLDRDGLPY